MLQGLHHWYLQTIGCDRQERAVFLSIIASQLESDRSYQEIFQSFAAGDNANFKRLARLALKSDSDGFASGFEPYFGKKDAQMLVLGQKFNQVPRTVEKLLEKREPELSVGTMALKRNAIEWVCLAALLVVAVGLYLASAGLAQDLVDLRDTNLVVIGGLLYEYAAAWGLLAAVTWMGYVNWRDKPGPVRKRLKRLGLYRFHDALYAIELMQVLELMTHTQHGGGGVNTRSIVEELKPIFARSRLRKAQFVQLLVDVRYGKSFTRALGTAGILPAQEFELFRGLTTNQSIEQINRAARAVSQQLKAQTLLRIRAFGTRVKVIVVVVTLMLMAALIEITVGAGTRLVSLPGMPN